MTILVQSSSHNLHRSYKDTHTHTHTRTQGECLFPLCSLCQLHCECELAEMETLPDDAWETIGTPCYFGMYLCVNIINL